MVVAFQQRFLQGFQMQVPSSFARSDRWTLAPSRKAPDRFQPAKVLAVRPGASGPSSAARASEKSPLEMPFR